MKRLLYSFTSGLRAAGYRVLGSSASGSAAAPAGVTSIGAVIDAHLSSGSGQRWRRPEVRARTPWAGTTRGVRLRLPSSAGECAAVRTVSKIFEV